MVVINFGRGASFFYLSSRQIDCVHMRHYEVLYRALRFNKIDNSVPFVWSLLLPSSQSVGRSGPDGSIALHAPQSKIITTYYFSHKIKSWRTIDTTAPRAIFNPLAAHKKIGTDSKPSSNPKISIPFLVRPNHCHRLE